MIVLFDGLKPFEIFSVWDDANRDTKDEEKGGDDDQVALEEQKYSFAFSLFTKGTIHKTKINLCPNVYQTCQS